MQTVDRFSNRLSLIEARDNNAQLLRRNCGTVVKRLMRIDLRHDVLLSISIKNFFRKQEMKNGPPMERTPEEPDESDHVGQPVLRLTHHEIQAASGLTPCQSNSHRHVLFIGSCCILVLSPILYWLNGPSVSQDQFIMRCVLVGVSAVTAMISFAARPKVN